MDADLLRFDKKKTLVFIDAETFNLCLSFIHNLPWQVAMLKVRGDNIVDTRDFYIKWKTHLKISDEAAKITRYSPLTMEQKGKTQEEVFPIVDEWLSQADYIVGQNVFGFDYYLLKDWYKMHGKDASFILNKLIDTNCLAKGLKLNIPFKKGESLLEYQYKMYHKRQKGLKTSLITLGKEYGIDHDYMNLHNALVDLELNVKVFNKQKWHVEI